MAETAEPLPYVGENDVDYRRSTMRVAALGPSGLCSAANIGLPRPRHSPCEELCLQIRSFSFLRLLFIQFRALQPHCAIVYQGTSRQLSELPWILYTLCNTHSMVENHAAYACTSTRILQCLSRCSNSFLKPPSTTCRSPTCAVIMPCGLSRPAKG